MKMVHLNVLVGILHIASFLRSGSAVLAFTEPRAAGSAFLTIDSKQQSNRSSVVAAVQGTLGSLSELDLEADAEMGQDLAIDLVAKDAARSPSDPATLAEYCSGAPTAAETATKLDTGVKVKANWEDYGTYYPGEITGKHRDGTVDIKYDDGFTEKRVDAGDVKIRKNQGEKKESAAPKAQPRDDPACKLQDFLGKTQTGIKKVEGMVKDWLSSQRAKMVGEDMPKPPATTVAPAPAPTQPPPGITDAGAAPAAATQAPASAVQSDELEKLKAELADLDAYIKELEAKKAELDQKLEDKLGVNAAPAPAEGAVKTVDDLIAEYKAKIAQRQARIAELLAQILERQAELARLGEAQLSIADIDKAVAELEEDLEEGTRKRDELKKQGELDPELRAIIDAIIEALSKLRAKVDNLIALEKKAEEQRKAAEEEAKAAEEEARRKAKEEGKDPDEAAAEAAAAVKKKHRGAEMEAEMEAMAAAKEVSQDLKEAGEGANKLDTGLHPHGDKWWRYRYEHSHIEAMVMIFISWLFLVWSEIWRHTKKYIHDISLPKGVVAKSEFEDAFEQAHGTIMISWLHSFADQMLVCIFVFLSIWVIAKTHIVNTFPQFILPSDDMRVPATGEEYRLLAIDICTIFNFAIAFYFMLMYSVAHAIRHTTAELEAVEDNVATTSNITRRRSSTDAVAVAQGLTRKYMAGSLAESAESFERTRTHFVESVQALMATRDEDSLKNISRILDDDFNNFPLSQYLKMNVRMSGMQLFLFSWTMWLPMICLFLCLLLLHRYQHMGYIRIMMFATGIVLILIMTMSYATKSFVEKMKKVDTDGESTPRSGSTADVKKQHTIHEDRNTEGIFLAVLEFALFFTCYGVARMICQSWMWELHFWPVLGLTIAAVVSAVVFVAFVAPAIPVFLCVMSLPPYIDPYNLRVMEICAQEHMKLQEGKGKRTQSAPL
jgi:hypothetical protein